MSDMSLNQAGSLAVSLKNVCLAYDSSLILKNISLSVSQGSCCVLIGSNGAGKSTLLKFLAGVLDDTWGYSGRCEIFASVRERSSLSPDKRISWMSQQLSISEDMSVGEFLKLFDSPDADLDCAEVLREFALEELIPMRLSALSGGQWQRVRLAQALMRQADLLLFDEPDVALDSYWRSVLWRMLEKRRMAGTTVILALHRYSEVFAWVTEWVGLNEGRVVFSGEHQGMFPQAYVDRLFLGKDLDSLNLLG